MTEEPQIARLKFAGAKKASMKRRDAHHDYTERRMYMVTLEVEGRRPVFGSHVGDAFAERGSIDEPRIELSEPSLLVIPLGLEPKAYCALVGENG